MKFIYPMNKKYDAIHIRDYYPSQENPAASSWVFDQVKALQQYNFNSIVISPTPYLPYFLRSKDRYYLYPKADETIQNYKGTDVIRPLFFKVPNNKMLSLNFKNLSKSIIRASKKVESFSLIHAHFGQNGVGSLRLKEKYNVPLITSFYGYDSGRLSSLFRKFYKDLFVKGDVFLALSEDMKYDLIDLGFPEDKIKIHHLGINLQQFSPLENKVLNHFIFLVVARLDESKGVQDVIKAFSLIQNSNTRLHIVGDGKHKPELIKLANKLKLKTKVKFINNFKADNPRQVVIEEMQYSDVVLLTSFIAPNGAKEGTPVVLMEAQACGKPCIATDHAGIPEVVINNKTGFITNERNVDLIADRMKLLYEDLTLRTEMGQNAILHIQKEYNQDVQIQRLFNVYNNLINKYGN